ncbi:MAG: outer membrane beta-barrel protein [Crocinitomicaceae bacterium]
MIKYITYSIILLISVNSYSQSKDTTNIDKHTQSRFTPGVFWRFTGLVPRVGKQGPRYDRLIVDLYHNTWLGERNSINPKWYSIGFNASFMFDIPFNDKSTVSMGIGLGFSHLNIHYNGMLGIDSTRTSTTLMPVPASSPDRRLNKFVANYIQIPLEFRFRTPGVKHFKFHVGAVIGVRLNSYERWKEGNLKFKEFNQPDVARFRYGVTARIGIRNWSIYGAYYFSDIFTNSNSSKLNPLCIGISVSLF